MEFKFPQSLKMKEKVNYLEINKQTWNKKTEIHINSEFYDIESFFNGKSTLNSIELELLGDVANKNSAFTMSLWARQYEFIANGSLCNWN